jgi:LuxR family transcriptional regulator, maltose regulon positive regulatory protein
MMMTYFLHDNFESAEGYSPAVSSSPRKRKAAERDGVHVLRDKLRIPRFRGVIGRKRVEELLSKSLTQFPATLVSGRAGTGKTVLAARFARRHDHAAWYSVESSDTDWNVFANYFAACILRAVKSKAKVADVLPAGDHASTSVIATLLVNVFAEAETELRHDPLLVVLDGIHHLFDADWFGEFFGLLLTSLPENINLLLLCRSKPPNPLWRLRSKQQLNVIDEKVLVFNLAETVELLRRSGLSRVDAEQAHAATFGRISKLLQCIGQTSAEI